MQSILEMQEYDKRPDSYDFYFSDGEETRAPALTPSIVIPSAPLDSAIRAVAATMRARVRRPFSDRRPGLIGR
jgi:hypothetical protein